MGSLFYSQWYLCVNGSLNFNTISLSIVFLMINTFCDCLNNLYPFQDHEDVPLCFPLHVFFFFSPFMFRSGIHLELFHVYHVRYRFRSILFHTNSQFTQHYLTERPSFTLCLTLFVAFIVNQVTMLMCFCFSILFQWLIGLCILEPIEQCLNY